MNIEKDFQELILRNGLTVWLSPDHSEPKVYGGMVVKAGAKDTPNTGIAHYFEHIMFKGTDTIGTKNFALEAPLLEQIANKYEILKSAKTEEERSRIQKDINELNIQAAQYAIPNDFNNLIGKYGGSGLNAGTSYDYTLFFNTFTSQYLEHWCLLNSERMINPVFRLFQSELETVYEEKNMYDDDFSTRPTQEVMERVMAPHPYRYPIIGSAEHLKTPDLHEMQTFFEKMYLAGNMALVLTGDFRMEGIEELLERTFGRIKPGTPYRSDCPSPRPFGKGEKLAIKLPIQMLKASGRIWHTIPNNHPDQIALSVIQELLSNESKTGSLDRLVLENRVIEASAMNMALNDVGLFGFIVISKPLKSGRFAQKLVMSRINSIIKGEFTDEELRRVKLSLRRSLILQWENPEKRRRLLMTLFAQGKTWAEYTEEQIILEGLTRENICATAKKYLTDSYLEVYKKTGKYKKEKLAKPPYDPIVTPSDHTESPFAHRLQEIEVQPLPLRTLDLQKDAQVVPLNDSGLAKLYRTENPSNDLFSLDLVYFHANYYYPLTTHLSTYLELVGCQKYSEHEFNARLQSIGATIHFEDKDNIFVIRVTGFDCYFKETIELLHAFLFTPLAEKKKMSKLIQTKEISDKALRKDPNSLSNRLLNAVMHEERAAFRKRLTLKQLKRLKPEELLAELSQVLSTEADIHYTGKLPTESVAETLKTALKTDHISIPWRDYLHLEAKEVEKPSIHFLHDSAATQAIIRAYLPLGTLNKEELGAIRLYDQYCGGSMGSLLFQEIREYRSLAYGVSSTLNTPAYHRTSECASDLTFYLSTQAEKLTEAVRLLDQLVHRSPDDLMRYNNALDALKSKIYTHHPFLRMRSRTIALLQRQRLTKDLPLVLLDELEGMTPEKLVAIHNKLVASKPLTYIIVGDRKKIDFHALSDLGSITEYHLKDLLL